MRMQGWKRRFILITCNTLALLCFAFVLWIRLGTTTLRGPVVSVQPCQYRAGNAPTGTLLAGSEVTIRSSENGRLYHLGCSAQSYPLGTSVVNSVSPVSGVFPSDASLTLLTIAGVLCVFVGAWFRVANPRLGVQRISDQSREQRE
jgi:hypothetical protein